ncbi:MAG: hypothetical protein A2381_03800 [Bdellovibrionales bacterium RIFOXYB1_FULL_37_110]|nr:MAG: hypothetical protein A2417_16395 [Bdellovibrionales bacterium RIFOXYC1_FULL_37_79]OFZ59160.1 MAG: hypothetical protein A2381_03800 [Bdellovibrionales bacterium RIFOXYB1_FULL_37_110]OFZ64165.1 MAG: hypothetical protein A2577_14830 [Bdellovibrionales bacterium RIFOXYD1_FULL_36_51]
MLISCASKNFVVYCKKPFAGPEQVIKYLGQYTHRIAISNYRLIKTENDQVYFKVRNKDYPEKTNIEVLDAQNFMERFLQHVLPKGHVRIRHFGILGNRYKKEKITLIRNLQQLVEKITITISCKELLKQLSEIDVELCPKCKKGKLMKTNPFANQLTPLKNSA